ncbi:hypothetical protein [Paenibacillus sp. GCM10027626]|uniref:YphA family membrane protein n=1 Tax=Paenibacillus sp. GCM10027626 TaxID=3273411 RepID=UPI0036428134
MGAGFLAAWLLAMGLVLYVTGWKRQVAGEASVRLLWSMAVLLALLHPWPVRMSDHIVMSGSALGATMIAIVVIFTARPLQEHISVLLSAALAAGLSWWSHYLYRLDPVMVVVAPEWDAPILIGFIASLLTERFRYHAAISVLAVMAAEIGLAGQAAGEVAIGTLRWWDQTVCAVCMTRLLWNIKYGLQLSWMKMTSIRTRARGGN